MSDTDLHRLTLVELRNLLAQRKLSSVELLDCYAARIERLNPAVNSVVTLDLERAYTEARLADAEVRAVQDAVHLADVWLDPVVTFPATGAPAQAWSRSQWLEQTLPAWKVAPPSSDR